MYSIFSVAESVGSNSTTPLSSPYFIPSAIAFLTNSFSFLVSSCVDIPSNDTYKLSTRNPIYQAAIIRPLHVPNSRKISGRGME